MIREFREALHGLGAGGVEAGDVDGEVALEVEDGNGEWIGGVAFGAGVCYTVEEGN